MKQSNYNVIVKIPNSNDSLVYNTLYKGLVRLEEKYIGKFVNCNFDENNNTEFEILNNLKKQKFIIEDKENELEFIKYEFYKAMFDHSQLVLTIAPTLSCNFKCQYCYETSRNELISEEGMDAILDFVKERYNTDSFKKLKINWYGGEPLIAIGQMIRISELLIKFSNENKIEYTARMVSNGSLITDEIIKQLKNIKVKDVQLTIDGLKENHDKRRISKDGKSTFDMLVKNTKSLIANDITVGIRMNTDEINKNDYLKLVEVFKDDKNAYVYMGHLRKYKADLEKHGFDFFSKERFSELEYNTFEKIEHPIEDLESILECKKVFCAATIDNNFVIDEKCNVYKCWNDIGNNDKVIFNLTEKLENRKFNKEAFMEYMGWNPFSKEECKNCKVLPLCAGGCVFESYNDKELYCYPPKYNIEKYILKYYNYLKNKK